MRTGWPIDCAKQNLNVGQQHTLRAMDEDGTVLGDYYAGLFVDRSLIVELKTCRALADEHTAQLLGCLRATHIEHGLLVNFGSPRMEIRKFVLSEAR